MVQALGMMLAMIILAIVIGAVIGGIFFFIGVKLAKVEKGTFGKSIGIAILIAIINGACVHISDPDQEQAVESQPRTSSSKPRDVMVNSIGMKLAYIPPGEFMMGSPSYEEDRQDNEGPVHRVKISKGFWIGVYEVTQSEYEKVMGRNPSRFRGDNNPVETVSWDDATEFCRKLSQKEGRTYRLPTEAQWEYACRAGTTTRFSFGNDDTLLGIFGWYTHNSRGRAHPVGQKRPNAFGLYDMHGNVWEYCRDYYDSGYYNKSSTTDPENTQIARSCIVRGGCWLYIARPSRSAYRGFSHLDNVGSPGLAGFRIVLESK